jgi:hypothetical protein
MVFSISPKSPKSFGGVEPALGAPRASGFRPEAPHYSKGDGALLLTRMVSGESQVSQVTRYQYRDTPLEALSPLWGFSRFGVLSTSRAYRLGIHYQIFQIFTRIPCRETRSLILCFVRSDLVLTLTGFDPGPGPN